ncbi:DUF6745 domain-containing protein [Asanoa iriomotensis]|uniref:DUF6745 domain-containing protein n=1 Tax=Asanoa iriomotensis TaxID=234613 RepID=A0ABQ4C0S1_9ACTN|nr:hypothetical protein [Asanoa iriomotensis]GIF56373.1 hypothetical protein Air01nite_24680 [Asanoa iriomotensis]
MLEVTEAHAHAWMEREFRGRPSGGWRTDTVAQVSLCYEAAGLTWPGTVVWVSAPRAGEPIAVGAAFALARRRAEVRWQARPRLVRRTIVGVRDSVRALWWSVLRPAPVVAGLGLGAWAGGSVWWLGAVIGTVVGNWLGIWLWQALGSDPAYDRVTARRLADAVAEIDRTRARIRAAVLDPLDTEVRAALGRAEDKRLRTRIEVAVDAAAAPVWAALRKAARGWPDLTGPDSGWEVEQGIRRALPPGVEPPSGWSHFGVACEPIARQHDGRVARLAWLRTRRPAEDDRWSVFDAYAAAGRHWWWPHPDFVVIAHPPAELHVERSEAGTYELHRAAGPAVAWTSGPVLHFRHNEQVGRASAHW